MAQVISCVCHVTNTRPPIVNTHMDSPIAGEHVAHSFQYFHGKHRLLVVRVGILAIGEGGAIAMVT